MRRLALAAVLVGVVLGESDAAETPAAHRHRVGILSGLAASTAEFERGMASFRDTLATAGWVEGRNLVLDVRLAGGRMERAPDLAAELVGLKPDILVVSGNPMIVAAKRSTATIPIVMINAGDPVGTGLVAS